MNELAFVEWPKDRPRPSEPQITAARMRYRADCDKWIAQGDCSDFNMGLEFAMGTYNRALWWHFFFPEEECVLHLFENMGDQNEAS